MMKRLTFILVLGILVQFGFSQYKVSDKAEDFKLKNVDGKMLSMGDYPSAKGFIVIFTCNHCPYSVAYEDRINELDKMFKKDYPVIAINPNDPKIVPEDSFEKMKLRAKEKAFTFPYLFDETQEVYKAFGATRTPHVYVLSRKGMDYIVEYIGAIDNNYKNASSASEHYVADAVKSLLKGKKPKLTETKAIGCSIKAK